MTLAIAILLILSTNLMIADRQFFGASCSFNIESFGDQYFDQNQLKMPNKTERTCQLRNVSLKYDRKNRFQATGESLAELYEVTQLLRQSARSFSRVKINIVQANGLSVDFQIPSFKGLLNLQINLKIFDFRVLNRDGAPQEDCSADYPVFNPWIYAKSTIVEFASAIRYYEDICPTIFTNSFIEILTFADLAQSTIKHNMLTFKPTNETLNSTIQYLELSGYGISFNQKIFPSALFSETKGISLGGLVSSFETRTLRNSSLNFIQLNSLCLKKLFHNSPNWLNDANLRTVKDTLEIDIRIQRGLKIISDYSGYYRIDYFHETFDLNPFDDASFCIFYQIELYSLDVQFEINLIDKRGEHYCNCVLFWLVSNNRSKFDTVSGIIYDLDQCAEDQDNLSQKCQFDKMAQRCSIESIEPISYVTIIETIFGFEFAKYLSQVWLTPVASVVGVIANFLVIRTFRKIKNSPEYRRNKLTDKGRFMWVYTYYNSWFVLFHSLVFAFIPITSCVEYGGIYCPRIALTKFSQAYYLFVQSFFGNTMRLMANMSQTLFVLFRFGLNTDRLDRFRKIRPEKLLVFLSAPATLLSLVTLFTNDRYSLDILLKDSSYYLLISHINQEKFVGSLKIVYLLNVFLGTILFTLFNMLIDLRMLFLLRKQNAQRAKEEVENRITKMVILNGLFSFLFRMPEMVTTLLFFVYLFDHNFFESCFTFWEGHYSVCLMLFDISRFLLTISFTENLLLLYLFNPSFKKHFKSKRNENETK
nr:G protein-coupled receptor [Proales similis]